jgi:hypothetical protein
MAGDGDVGLWRPPSVNQNFTKAILVAFLAMSVLLFAWPSSASAMQVDTDSDGVEDAVDRDDDNDGIIDTDEGGGNGQCRDTDDDGVCDHQDLDSDNDGIADLVEAGLSWGVFDTDLDGVVDQSDFVDDDADGLDDALEAAFGQDSGVGPIDTDNDGVDDILDLDSDDDRIPDAVEALPTASYALVWGNDGDVRDDDLDGDGVWAVHDDVPGHGASFVDPQRTDNDVHADFRDPDSDGDGTQDRIESGLSPTTAVSHRDPDGIVGNPSDDLSNEWGDTSEVAYREVAPRDFDDDGVIDELDSAPADPCIDPAASGWVARAINDCDGDGLTVGAGDPDDFTPNIADAPTPASDTEDTPPPSDAAVAAADEEGQAPVSSSTTPPNDDLVDAVDEPDAPAPQRLLPVEQNVAGAAVLRVVGELVFDADLDGEDLGDQPLDGAVVELWSPGADDRWSTNDDVLISSEVHDGGFDLAAQTPGEFEVRVVVASLPAGLALADTTVPRYRIGTAVVESSVVELEPFGFVPYSVCGMVTRASEPVHGIPIAVNDAAGNTITTSTDEHGTYCAVGSLEQPLEAGPSTVVASTTAGSVQATVSVDTTVVEAPELALDALPDVAPEALAYAEGNYISDFLIVGGTVAIVGLLALLVMYMMGQPAAAAAVEPFDD